MKYLSLFSGIGGFELGLENAEQEFECVGFSEVDSYARSIYTRHFPRHRDLGDATKIDPKQIEDFDLLVGGFPCQAFSLSGYRKGFNDCRGTLFFEIARICAEKRPRYLILENVKGLLSHRKGETFEKMLRVLAELGYDVEWEVLNSKSFGTAQNRERLYIKGYFREKCGCEILSAKRVGRETSVQKLKPFKFNRQVKKRIHTVDLDELVFFLRYHKESVRITSHEIAMMLQRSESEVEHWFRTDKYFAPPPAEVWDTLKVILKIKDDKFDAFIKEFEWVDGVFEQDKRAYETDGLSPTLTTRETLAKINIVGNLSRTGHDGANVLGEDGLSTALTATNHKHPLKVKTNTKKGYDEIVEGDGLRLCHPTSKLARGRSQKGQTGALSTKADWGTIDKDFRIRRLTPRECERLQAFPSVIEKVELWLSEKARENVQFVAEKWHKSQKLVGNVQSDKLQKSVPSVEKNSQPKSPQTKKLVLQNVQINSEGKQIQLFNLEKSSSSVNNVEKKNGYLQYTKTEDFAHLIVGINIILEKIIRNGKVESLLNEQLQIHQENGKTVVKLFGGEMMPLVNSVGEDLTIEKELMKFITSDLSDTRNQDMMLTTLFCYVLGVIIGSIPKETDISCLEKIEFNISIGWTELGDDLNFISDTQRYKCLGNAVTTTVMTYVANTMFG